jgi:hypothetical protein
LHTKTRVNIGWREWVGLPEMGVDRIKGKIDTGARTSALHAVDMEEYFADGILRVRFRLHPIQRDTRHGIVVDHEVIDERSVRSSSGITELRPVIQTVLALGARQWPIEITLTDRANMGFRLLLGREALRKRVLVDAGRSFLLGSDATS